MAVTQCFLITPQSLRSKGLANFRIAFVAAMWITAHIESPRPQTRLNPSLNLPKLGD
jgi:hypothetical protein